ncbi:MAG TPA: aldolase/citrate lyase family protein [bacterium]|nr:aldolase/citrate lyase family protein [bacterium]
MRNLMKAKLLAGQPARGVSVMIPSPQIVEMLGRLGFDWVLIDCEHGTISRESVEEMVRAAEASGITPLARPAGNHAEAILHVLECGALGVQVPHIRTAGDARRVVEAVKYHPLGSRSLAASTRPAGYGLGVPMAGYVEAANRETLVCVQLEDEEGLRHLDEMLEVEGVDVFFVGPSDLAQSMGYPGRPEVPEVQQAMAQAFAHIAASGRVAGSTCRADTVRDRVRQRVLYLYTHLPALLAAGAAPVLGAGA